ncbi:unnamed protein product [Rotaria socialis]|uniref:Zinc finger PHD-type domain-containing protein n=2 Tax=Rotaria socialis TaxID=392032 RepID=A0A819VCA5_9BILA|nr:unnamed protein product [Rotaria socialis]CAF4370589.1 unnamed protein product [Rotaria socialis]CAF4439924.1 unnamed protein product [Rotaria socialis]
MIASTTSPIIIPVSSILRVLGKNYDESILLTSTYNQSLLRDRRHRLSNIIDNQTGIQQINSSLYHNISDRLSTTRTDQVCVYPRRSYCRHIRYNPYLLTLPQESKIPKIDIMDNNVEIINPYEQKSNENEIKNETITTNHDDQNTIPDEYMSTSKTTKRKITMNHNCQNCKQKFKNKTQLNLHIIKCQNESEQNEQMPRRHYSKNESLLVSLLKQEAITEKKSDIQTNDISPSITMTQTSESFEKTTQIDNMIKIDSNSIQIKLEKNDVDFILNDSEILKKTISKAQSISSCQSLPKPLSIIACTICGEGNIINDELIKCSTCQKSMHAYKCLSFENNKILKTIKTYSWECVDCKKCIQCGTVEHDDELLFCDHCDRAYHMDCLKPPLSEPPPVCLLVPIAYFLSFTVAVKLGHSKFEFPFLSRSSTDSPESCIFSQIINFASFVLFITIYIRYRQLSQLIRNNPTCGKKYSQANFIFFICGLTAAFSLSIISNFPHANVFPIRLFATYLTFTASVVALYCEMLLSSWIRPLLYSSRVLPIIRTIITVISTLALFACIVFMITSVHILTYIIDRHQKQKTITGSFCRLVFVFQTITVIKYDNEKKIWAPTSPGWMYHLSSIISAWILTISLLVYTLTLIFDFRRIKVISPKIFLTDDMIDDQD